MRFVIKANGPESAEQIKFLAQVDLRRHLGPVRPAYGRQSHCAEQDRIEAAKVIEGRGRKRVTGTQILAGSGRKFLVLELRRNARLGCVKHFQRFRNYVWSNAVTGQ